MKIVNTKIAAHCEDDSTVVVTVLNKDGKELNVHVQTTEVFGQEQVFSQELDCIIYDDEGKSLDKSVFIDYENDIEKIINKVEKFLKNN